MGIDTYHGNEETTGDCSPVRGEIQEPICELRQRRTNAQWHVLRDSIVFSLHSVLSDAHTRSTWACTSTLLDVLMFASASAWRSVSMSGAATLGAWLCRCSTSRVRCALRKARKGRSGRRRCHRVGAFVDAASVRRRIRGCPRACEVSVC